MHSFIDKRKAVVIGAGFAGLSASVTLASKGYNVTLIEKNNQTGGRAGIFRQDGFTFDMGPSWYWMPDVIEKFFNRFGKSTTDYFELKRLNPSYQVVFGKEDVMKLPANMEELKATFETIEKGSASKLDKFLAEAKYKYETAMNDFVYLPGLSIMEFAEWKFVASLFRLDMFRSFSSHARKYFKNPRLIQIMEFPVLFLGAKPANTPALYSMMNYADMELGTWYPMGGMWKLAEGMSSLARELGVEIRLNEQVERMEMRNQKAVRVITDKSWTKASVVVAAADYHHVEQTILESKDRTHSEKYWERKTMAPSCLIYYVGVNKKIKKLLHHNLFFDQDFASHAESIYDRKDWPDNPLFYVCCPSVTDDAVAPEGMENLFILIPVAAGLPDSGEIREKYFQNTLHRLESFAGENISEHIVFHRSYAQSDFVRDYNAYKGNAYGLANTLRQTAFLRPSIRSRKVKNLFYAGQLTVPGPGIPPSIISGQVVADYISANYIN